MDEKVRVRLMRYVLINPDDCWLWTGGTARGGYGKFWLHGKNIVAHRATYELYKGSIPEGLTLDHLCRNRLCVNPDHLEPVTMAENLLRGVSFSAANARKTHCPKGHPYNKANTLHSKKGRYCRLCSRERWMKSSTRARRIAEAAQRRKAA